MSALTLTHCGGPSDQTPTPTSGTDPESIAAPAPATLGMYTRDDLDQDPDGDGLTTGQELEGWRIVVDEAGYPDDTDVKLTPGGEQGGDLEGGQGVVARVAHVSRVVTSSPASDDTDGDGLSDYDEFLARTDPRRPDTDGDGLTDLDELRRWGTNPRSVDTDSDARGPDRALNPDPALFDGAELKLDADGQPALDATSPRRDDTDGDGVDDFTELSSPTRSPLIADSPFVVLEQTPGAEFDIYLNTTYADDVSRSQSYGSTSAASGTQATSLNVGLGTKTDIEISATLKTKVGAGLKLALNPFEDIESETTVGVGYSQTTGASLSTDFSSSFTSTLSSELTRSEQTGRSRTQTTSDGGIRYPMDLVNRSDLAFSLSDLSVVALFYSLRTGSYLPLGVLTPESSAETAFVMGPRERVSLILRTDRIPEERMLEVMRNPTNLTFQIGYYTLTGATGRNFELQQETVVRRCVTLEIDLGDGDVRRHQVAANVRRGLDGSFEGITIGELLDKVGIEHEVVEIMDPDGGSIRAQKIEGLEPTLRQDAGPALPPLADLASYDFAGDPGQRQLTSGWFAGILDRNRLPRSSSSAFTEVRVFPGDYIQLTYTSDRDRDGLTAREERTLGTSPMSVDTDRDGLSDYFEARQGWLVEPADAVSYRVFPSARTRDTDGDGLTDLEEYQIGTDPGRIDTDQDGAPDKIDHERGLQSPNFRGALAFDSVPLRLVVDSINPFLAQATGATVSFFVAHAFPLSAVEVSWDESGAPLTTETMTSALGLRRGEHRFTMSQVFARRDDGPRFDNVRDVVIRAKVRDEGGALEQTVCTQRVRFVLKPTIDGTGQFIDTYDIQDSVSKCCAETAVNLQGACP